MSYTVKLLKKGTVDRVVSLVWKCGGGTRCVESVDRVHG